MCDKFLIVQELLIFKASHTKLVDVLETMVISCQDCEFFGTEECEHQTHCHNNLAKQALKEAGEVE